MYIYIYILSTLRVFSYVYCIALNLSRVGEFERAGYTERGDKVKYRQCGC